MTKPLPAISPPEPADRRSSHPGVTVPGAPVGSALLQAIRAHATVATDMLAQIGLSPPQELVLLWLADQGGSAPQRDLVHYLNRDRSTVTNTLQAMERAGLITRRSLPSDRRAIEVALTAKGRKLLPRVRALWLQLERRSTALIVEEDREVLLRSLAAIRDSLRSGEAG